MSTLQPTVASAPDPSRRGRASIVAGAILITVSIVGGILGTVLTVGQFDESDLNDVVIDGAPNPAVPGKLSFRIVEPLNSDDDDHEIRVGVAVDYSTLPIPDCVLQDSNGTGISLSAPSADEQLMSDQSGDQQVLGSAILGPGKYEAICTVTGEPSDTDATFTVGRLFGFSDLRGVFAPILWFFAIAAVAVIMFVVGVIFLIVGLVRRSKGRKAAANPFPYGPGGPGGPGGSGAPYGAGYPGAPGGYPGGPGGYGPQGGYSGGPGGYGPQGGYPGGPQGGSPDAPGGQPGGYAGYPGYPGYGPQGEYPPGQGPGGGPPSPPAWPGAHPPGPGPSQAPPQGWPGEEPQGWPGEEPPAPVPPPYTPPPEPETVTHPPPPRPPEEPAGWSIPPSKKQ